MAEAFEERLAGGRGGEEDEEEQVAEAEEEGGEGGEEEEEEQVGEVEWSGGGRGLRGKSGRSDYEAHRKAGEITKKSARSQERQGERAR